MAILGGLDYATPPPHEQVSFIGLKRATYKFVQSREFADQTMNTTSKPHRKSKKFRIRGQKYSCMRPNVFVEAMKCVNHLQQNNTTAVK